MATHAPHHHPVPHDKVDWDRQVTLNGWMELTGTMCGVILALFLTIFHCALFGVARPRLFDLTEHLKIWEKQVPHSSLLMRGWREWVEVGDCCHPGETVSWLRDTFGEEGWEEVERKGTKGDAKKKGLTKGASGRPKPKSGIAPIPNEGVPAPAPGNYMDIGIFDRLGADVKQDMNINN